MIKSVSIKVRRDHTDVIPYVKKLIIHLENNGVKILLPEYDIFANDDISKYIVNSEEFLNSPDMVIGVGGDGTLLKTARLFAGKGIPILGINRGTLGFLTEFLPDEAIYYLDEIIKGNFIFSERAMLEVTHKKNTNAATKQFFLNDAVISRGTISHLITIQLEIDGKTVSSFAGDGLIISTATGSTAYSLSAGGPIISPTIQNVYIVIPICPHTLTIRPLIIPATSILKVKVLSKFDNLLLTIDGQETTQVDNDDEILICGTDKNVHLINHPDQNFYEILRQKFSWGKTILE